MFGIGSSLREARLGRGLELSQIERDTRIRSKYLGALEEDRFDALPGPAYAKGFLRTYADYLGLDAQQFVDEYSSRFAPEEQLPPPAPVRIRRQRRILDLRLLFLPAAAILALIGWQLERGTSHHTALPPTPPHALISVALIDERTFLVGCVHFLDVESGHFRPPGSVVGSVASLTALPERQP